MIKKEDKITKQPIFSKGSLVYKNSGHTLTKSGKYYRCSQQIKGLCANKNEKLISSKNLVENFTNIIDKFTLPEGEAGKIFPKLFQSFFFLAGIDTKRDLEIQAELEPLVKIMISDLNDNKEIDKRDFLEFKRVYFKSLKNGYKTILISSIMEVIFLLAHSPKDKEMMSSFVTKTLNISPKKIRSNFAMQIKKIYLSDNGNIESIEFEGWAWYIINFLKKEIPFYLSNMDKNFTINTKKFNSLKISDVLEEFEQNNFRDAYSYSVYATKYSEEKYSKKIFDDFESLTMAQKINYLNDLLTLSIPMLYSNLAPIFGI